MEMSNVIPFPFSRMPAEHVRQAALDAVTESPSQCITSAAVGSDVLLEVGPCELWFSAEEFAELLEQWSETLRDAAENAKR